MFIVALNVVQPCLYFTHQLPYQDRSNCVSKVFEHDICSSQVYQHEPRDST